MVAERLRRLWSRLAWRGAAAPWLDASTRGKLPILFAAISMTSESVFIATPTSPWSPVHATSAAISAPES